MPQSKNVRRSALHPCVIALLILGTMTLSLLLCAGLQTTARAATTFVVTNTNDTGTRSLCQAILDASVKMVAVAIIDDNLDEPLRETAKVRLSTSGDLDTFGSQSIATLSITDDPAPSVSIGDVSIAEGDSGTTAFNFPVTLSAPSSQQVTVLFQVLDGTATGGGSDFFLPISNSITFAPGQTSATITILVIGDNTPEPDETFFINLASATNAIIGDGQGQGTILNDDATPTVSLSVNDVSVNEGNSGTTDAVFTVTMSGPATKVVTADVFVFGETASEVTDFQNVSPKLTFAPGQTLQTFAVPVIGDNIFEGNERFRVELRNQVNALIGDGIGFGTILDDETQPSLSINDITVIEGDSGRTDANFTVSLSGLSSNTVDFGFNVVSGSAVESEDFGGVGGANGIPPGFTSRTITVPIIGDTITEGDETFFVNISNVTNATIADGQGVGTIKDNESPASPPTFQFTAKFPAVSEGAGKLDITVTRSGNASSAGTVEYLTSTPIGGGVSDRSDYTLALGTLRFAAGEITKSFTLLLTDDAFVEGNEFILVTLSNPTGGASIGQPNPAIIKIVDDDSSSSTFNPIDGSPLFVRQHYHDFLNREPDASGFTFWQDEINQCGTNPQCLELKRINVSAAFFLSIEFQETGYLVHRVYKTAYGDAISQNVAGTVPIMRLSEFLRDSQRISQDVIVGQGDWQTQLENNKNAFALEFVQSQRFLAALPLSLTATEFVDRLNQNAGSVLTQSERDQLIAQLSSATDVTATRALVLREMAENSILRQREFNRAFVLMQYYGYLRRNPDDAPDNDFSGWKFWLNKLDQFNGNFVSAEMVKAFISSLEYRQRFGQP
jgi:hypothetical protein